MNWRAGEQLYLVISRCSLLVRFRRDEGTLKKYQIYSLVTGNIINANVWLMLTVVIN